MLSQHWLFRGGQSAQSLIEDQTRGAFTAAAVNGYEAVLEPTVMVKDVCYWMNYELADKKVKSFVVNTGEQASLLCPSCSLLTSYQPSRQPP